MVISFTLVFLKGNKTVEDLVTILETAFSGNGTMAFTIARDSLLLVLPSKS